MNTPTAAANFTDLCWFFVSEEWGICKVKLVQLLYRSQGLHLAMYDKPLFEYPMHTVADGITFDRSAEIVIDEVLAARDWANFWLGTAYYYAGYLEFFGF